MKNMIARGAAIGMFALALASCGGVGDAPEAKTDSAVTVKEATPGAGATFAIDTSRSKIGWKAAKVSLAHDGGFRNFNGTITVAGNQVSNVKINIDATSIWSDNDNLTGHLKGDDFFAVDKNPAATFEASQFTPVDTIPGVTHMVTGNLTMHGQTNSVTFPATIQVGADMVTAKADFIIKRKSWGIVYTGKPDDLISEDVRIIFDVTAVKPAV